MRRPGVLSVAAALLLGGCATTVERMGEGVEAQWQSQREKLLELEEWRLRGRIALSTEEEGLNGTLSWQQVYEDVDFRFRGPLGIGGFRIHGDRDRLRVKTSKGKVFFLQDPVVEMQAEFGWSVPVHSMRYWVVGVSDPGLPTNETLGPEGRLTQLEQMEWLVRYTSYRDYDGNILPRKVVMESEAVRIRLAVDEWQLSLAPGSPEL